MPSSHRNVKWLIRSEKHFFVGCCKIVQSVPHQPHQSDTTWSVGVSCALVAQVDSMDTMPIMIYENTSRF